MKQSILLTAVLLFISADVIAYTVCAPMSAGIGSCNHSSSAIDVFGKKNVVAQTIGVSEDLCRQMMHERITCHCVEAEHVTELQAVGACTISWRDICEGIDA